MKTTGIFTIHEYGIPIRSQSQPVYLHFFGDVHRDSPLHAADAWKKYLAYAKQGAHDNWFLGMGDYVDCCSTSERIAITSIRHALHEIVNRSFVVRGAIVTTITNETLGTGMVSKLFQQRRSLF